MATRLPVSEDAKAITERIAELRAERLAALVGCNCPLDAHTNTVTHKSDCPLRPLISIQINSLTENEQLKETLRSWRMRVNGKLVSILLVMALAFDPHILFLSWSAERQERLAATNLTTCTQAMQAISEGKWMADDPPLAMRCFRGNGFAADSLCIKNYNCEDRR